MQQNTHFEDIIDSILKCPGYQGSLILELGQENFFIITLLFKWSSFIMEFFAHDHYSFK